VSITFACLSIVLVANLTLAPRSTAYPTNLEAVNGNQTFVELRFGVERLEELLSVTREVHLTPSISVVVVLKPILGPAIGFWWRS
jgi:hypothetical protein